MKYGEIFQRATNILWRHKVLWIFGFILALFGGGAGGWSSPPTGMQYSLSASDLQRFGQRMPFLPGMPVDWGALAAGIVAILGLLAIVGLVVAVISIIVRYTSIGALIAMVGEIEASGDTSFRSGLNRGWRQLLRLFVIALIIGIVNAIVAFILVMIFAAIGFVLIIPSILLFRVGGGWVALGVIWAVLIGLALALLAIVVALIVAAAFTITREYAYRQVVLGTQGIFDGIEAAIQTLQEWTKQSVWIWVVLGLIRIAYGIVLIPVMLVVGFIAAFPGIAIYSATGSGLLGFLIALPLLVLGFFLLVALEGLYLTYQSATWTLVYLEVAPSIEE